MCDIVDKPDGLVNQYSKVREETEEKEANILYLEKADQIAVNHWIYDEGIEAELFCRHDPNEEWHKMEFPAKEQAIDCPAGTEIKLVVPKGTHVLR